MAGTPHGQPNNLNLVMLDVDREITGYGKHNRLVVFGSMDGSYVHIRDDIIPGRNLATPTPAQRLKVANGRDRMHPRGTRLEYVSSSEPYSGSQNWASIDHMYNIVRPKKG